MVNSKSPDLVHGGAGDDPQENETQLLLAMLDLALTNIDIAATTRDKEQAGKCLMRAVDTYGSVKGILPKVGLRSEQVALVNEHLDALRRRLWTGPTKSPDGR